MPRRTVSLYAKVFVPKKYRKAFFRFAGRLKEPTFSELAKIQRNLEFLKNSKKLFSSGEWKENAETILAKHGLGRGYYKIREEAGISNERLLRQPGIMWQNIDYNAAKIISFALTWTKNKNLERFFRKIHSKKNILEGLDILSRLTKIKIARKKMRFFIGLRLDNHESPLAVSKNADLMKFDCSAQNSVHIFIMMKEAKQ
ncbi:MAG: hypothetical protein Q7S21_04205 [archaeon]|nr:hypothetical protein [archaeon]